ncbi:MAG: toll/interleukin-1 receptor domain-containing protein [Isosphaerales bacterium]
MPLQYQLIALGPNAKLVEDRVREELLDGFRELDLDPACDLAILGVDQRSQFNAKCSVVGLWYGGDSPFEGEAEHTEALDSLLAMGAALFPLVESLDVFAKKIPRPLQPVNGIEWGDARLTGDILKAFGLTRELRQAFISYKRSDSAGIAKQLAHILFDRGYQVFLDTASVERGVAFQDVLHERLANIDLVILLDSPHALDSVWVHEELDMVNQLGLGVLQVAWTKPDPNEPTGVKLLATPGTEFSFRYGLEPKHFEDPGKSIGPDATLKAGALKEVADRAEQARIRSLGARRMRVVSYVRAEASRFDLAVNVRPAGPVEILKDGRVISTFFPIVGLPDAWVIYEQERRILEGKGGATPAGDIGVYRVLYDGLGILDDRLKHLRWLNDNLQLKTLRTEHLQDWLKTHEQECNLPFGERAGA